MNPTNNHADSAVHASTSAKEAQDYLNQLKSRDPEEVLGTASSHTLAGAMVQATVLTLVLMAVCTVAPMLEGGQETAAAPAPAAEVKAATPEPAQIAAKTPPTTTITPPVATTTPPNAKDAMDKIGANDTKQASPKVNPLEKSVDDLFKDLDK